GGGATENTIGATAAAARNLISGNAVAGIYIHGTGTNGNLVQGNYIGTDETGTSAVSNEAGVQMEDGSLNVIGGAVAGAGNVISGNRDDGVDFIGGANNTVSGNRIGTNAAGTAALGNGAQGVALGFGATGNTVGGAIVAARNLISGNRQAGVRSP